MAELDNCEVCLGTRGGTKGNENVIDGVITCDYCHAHPPRAAPLASRESRKALGNVRTTTLIYMGEIKNQADCLRIAAYKEPNKDIAKRMRALAKFVDQKVEELAAVRGEAERLYDV